MVPLLQEPSKEDQYADADELDAARFANADELEEEEEDADHTGNATTRTTTKVVNPHRLLQQKKEQMQASMDLSQIKLLVSKQEHMLDETQQRLQDNAQAMQDCEKASKQSLADIAASNQRILDLEARERAVGQLMEESMTNLLLNRKRLQKATAASATSSTMDQPTVRP